MPCPLTRPRISLHPYDVRCPLRPSLAPSGLGKDMPISRPKDTGSSFARPTVGRSVGRESERERLGGHLPTEPLTDHRRSGGRCLNDGPGKRLRPPPPPKSESVGSCMSSRLRDWPSQPWTAWNQLRTAVEALTYRWDIGDDEGRVGKTVWAELKATETMVAFTGRAATDQKAGWAAGTDSAVAGQAAGRIADT